MTILVSNANGKVGRDVAIALLKAGEKVRIGARDVAAARGRFPGAEIVSFDVAKPETVKAAMAGVTSVFSALPYELLPAGELVQYEAARAAGVKRFVKLSAMGAEDNPASPHSVSTKALAESGLEWTVLRPNFFMQNYALQMAGMVQSGAIYEPAENGASSFVDTRDIADMAVAALTKPGHNGKGYTLTGPAALTRGDVAALMTDAAGYQVQYVATDDAALRQAFAGMGASPILIELMSALYGYVRAGWTAQVSNDIETVLGRPARTFEAFARDHAQAWRKTA
jgi:uncharacterized protein YbjT (DUF2867 family)